MKNIIITILVMLVLGLGGYLVYDKVINKNDNNNEVVENEQEEIQESETQEKTSNYQILKGYDNTLMAVLYNEEVYVAIDNLGSNMSNIFGADINQTLNNTKKSYQEYNLGNLTILNDDYSNFRGMKLNISDVKAIYSFANGQGFFPNYGIFLLKNDGTVYGISLYSLINGKTTVTPISTLNSIVKLEIEGAGMASVRTYTVDANGNKYNINDYVPQDYNQW